MFILISVIFFIFLLSLISFKTRDWIILREALCIYVRQFVAT